MSRKGIDYTIDPQTGKYIMSEAWLRKRGFCCNALPRCRNCPWHPADQEKLSLDPEH